MDADTTPVKTDIETVVHIVAALTANATQHGANTVTVSRLPGPSIDPQVAVGSVDQPAMVIAVRDDGPGIAPEFLPRIFEKFEKDSFSSGTGLGLYVVRLMADAIGSSVSVATGSEGTVCEIAIPGSVRTAAVVGSA
jgi:two-component system OmpR family sensor kinase